MLPSSSSTSQDETGADAVHEPDSKRPKISNVQPLQTTVQVQDEQPDEESDQVPEPAGKRQKKPSDLPEEANDCSNCRDIVADDGLDKDLEKLMEAEGIFSPAAEGHREGEDGAGKTADAVDPRIAEIKAHPMFPKYWKEVCDMLLDDEQYNYGSPSGDPEADIESFEYWLNNPTNSGRCDKGSGDEGSCSERDSQDATGAGQRSYPSPPDATQYPDIADFLPSAAKVPDSRD